MMCIKFNIKELRIAANKTSKQVASDLNITRPYLSLIENQHVTNITLKLAILIANYYNVTVDDLYYIEDGDI